MVEFNLQDKRDLNIIQVIEVTYISLLIVGLGVSVFSFYVEPFGSLFIDIAGYNVSSVTFSVLCGSVLLLWILLHRIQVIPRIACSLSLPLVGIAFHETWWHIGCWYTWNFLGSQTIFWALYTAALFIATIVLHIKYDILKFSTLRLVAILTLLLFYRVGWQNVMDSGFFPALLAFENGIGPNPHVPFIYLNASIGRTVWLFLVNPSRRDSDPFKSFEEVDSKENNVEVSV